MSEPRNMLLLGANAAGEQISIDAGMANRHGLITGATGTGKTVTLQVLAESFSRLGVPVFTADVKGDLSGLAQPGKANGKIAERLEHIGIEDHPYEGCPVVFWDVYGKGGHAVRTTVSEMGPVLLANLLELNETQAGILYAAFIIADDQGLLLLDMKDLRSILSWMAEHRNELGSEYGHIASQSISAMQRRLLVLEDSGGEEFFGEPALNIQDLMRLDLSGRGVINLLDATTLYENPRIYATFLLWLLSELMAELPERGDAALPKLVFFFDEAHLLFDSAPKALLDRITQVVRLIRSKGVGVFFVSQYPNDVPDEVLGQLGSRIQHALRAYTPKEKKAVRVAAETFRQNPEIDTREMIAQLGVGEALVSTLDEKGRPTMVDWCLMAPPRSRIGPVTEAERGEIISRSPLVGRYDNMIDRDSAYEMLVRREDELRRSRELAAEEEQLRRQLERAVNKPQRRSSSRQSSGEAFLKSLARTAGTQIGRTIVRGILGAISGKR